MGSRYTPKQGQYLAFIYSFTKVNGQAPSEAEMQRRFRVSPPSVHQMALTPGGTGFDLASAGMARSIRVLIDESELPRLE